MINYTIEEYKMKNGLSGLTAFFQDSNLQLLSDFLVSDVSSFEDWIKESLDKVLSKESDYEEINCNVCGAEISYRTTKIIDNLSDDDDDYCEVDTVELRQLIDDWCEKVSEFRAKQGTK